MGRPTKLNEELTEALVGIFERGQTSIESACAYVGITPKTFHSWMSKGREGLDPYSDFLHAIEKARAAAVQSYLEVIHTAAQNGTWQAAAWWLERVLPEQYGRKTTVETISRDVLESEIARLEAQLADNDADH